MPETPLLSSLTERLRGVYRLGVNDGAGPLNGSDTFTRQFQTPPIQHEAAARIEKLETALKGLLRLDCPITDADPFGAAVVAHWTEQKAQGHGYADLYLNALAALSPAEPTGGENQ